MAKFDMPELAMIKMRGVQRVSTEVEMREVPEVGRERAEPAACAARNVHASPIGFCPFGYQHLNDKRSGNETPIETFAASPPHQMRIRWLHLLGPFGWRIEMHVR